MGGPERNKHAHTDIFHKISPKHLNRYVREFAGKHNERERGTLDIMRHVVSGLVAKRLMYSQLTADNGLPSGAQGRSGQVSPWPGIHPAD